jgi:hypothetical protein
MMVLALVTCERSPFAAQCVVGRAAVFLSLFIPVEIVARETVVLTLGFVPHRHMRLDVFFLHHPGQHRRGTVSGIADEALRFDVELLFDTLDHGIGALNLGRSMSGG